MQVTLGRGGRHGTRAPRPRDGQELRRVLRLLVRFSGGRKLYVLALVMLIFEAITTVFQPYRECDNSEERNNKNESHCRNQNIHGALSRQAP